MGIQVYNIIIFEINNNNNNNNIKYTGTSKSPVKVQSVGDSHNIYPPTYREMHSPGESGCHTSHDASHHESTITQNATRINYVDWKLATELVPLDALLEPSLRELPWL